MKMKRTFLVLMIIAATGLGCATFEPASPNSSLLIASVKINWHGKRAPLLASSLEFDKLTAASTDKSSGIQDFTHSRDDYYIFNNITPGVYQLHKAFQKVTTVSVGPVTTTVGIDVIWQEKMADISKTATVPGKIAYMGDFVVDMNFSGMLQVRPSTMKMTGQRTPEGMKRALEFIAAKWPESKWAAIAKEQLKSLHQPPQKEPAKE